MSNTITLGHLLLLLGLLATLYAFVQLATLARYRGAGHGKGTPGYARARDARRYTVWALVAAALLFALGTLTGLADIAILGGAG
ncbi:MAG TPA: hypothetical protein VGB59_01575 [Allosphingosinicella sp.]|jgi:hypothetical protein